MKGNLYTLFYTASKESRKLCQLIMTHQIPCEFLYSSDAEEGPILIDRHCYREERGLKQITDYINRIKDNYSRK
jgi:hypothetical protein